MSLSFRCGELLYRYYYVYTGVPGSGYLVII